MCKIFLWGWFVYVLQRNKKSKIFFSCNTHLCYNKNKPNTHKLNKGCARGALFPVRARPKFMFISFLKCNLDRFYLISAQK